ncbi:MAG: response regulator transcription factor [Chromatiales bacterium]|nr:response regulator transcription factor [Chromatiales bacterium]
MLNALLIEDDLDLAQTVVQYLALEQIRCDHASNGIAGLNLMLRERYDVLLLDLNLPRLDGLSVCERLRGAGDDTPVLMLTARDRLEDKIDGFRAGTDDYLIKPFELRELVVRVRALARRRSGQAQVLRCCDLEMNLNEKTARRGERQVKLSPTAWRLLEVLMRASPNVVSRKSLETAVWDDEPPDSNNLKVHVFNLRKAVDSAGERRLVHTVAGHGFAIRAESDEKAD